MTVDELIDAWEAAWSGKDPDAFASLCAADLHYEDPLTPEPLVGVEELARHAERLWAGFPDARLEGIGERLSNRQYVAAPCKLLGTHKEPLEGLPATNRFLVVHCVFYCELHGECLLRVRGFFDLYDAAVQLGVLPSRGSLGEKARASGAPARPREALACRPAADLFQSTIRARTASFVRFDSYSLVEGAKLGSSRPIGP
jgi:steroid delta-isomerase-like uncharacterized protein